MIKRRFDACLLTPADVPASNEELEVVGAFNPGAVATGAGEEVVLLVRVAERPKERRPGFTALPRWDVDAGRVVVDWTPNDELIVVDPRVVKRKADDIFRLTFTSHIRVVRSRDGRSIDSVDGPVFRPADRHETFGVEDPRITPIDGRFYFTYVAVSPHGAATALASTADFVRFERHGVIFPPENKDVVLFPEKINGAYAAFHRPNPNTHFAKPEMWFARSPDLRHWSENEQFLAGLGDWDTGRIGAGPPPIRTDAGWLHIYHGNEREKREGVVGAYAAGALLLDLNDPRRVIAHSPAPILRAEAEHERNGFVPNVIFPTGIVRRGDTLLIYSGAADSATGVAELSLKDVLATVGR